MSNLRNKQDVQSTSAKRRSLNLGAPRPTTPNFFCGNTLGKRRNVWCNFLPTQLPPIVVATTSARMDLPMNSLCSSTGQRCSVTGAVHAPLQARGKYCEHVHDVQEQVMQTTGSGMWASPVVEDSSFMNERVAFRIVPTCQMGFQHSGWKSLKEKHIFVFGLNLPDGVINRIPGGLNG